MLPAFATIDEFANRLPGGISDDDSTRAQAALDDASALIRNETGKTWVTDDELDADVPDIVVTVTCRAAMRAFVNPTGLVQDTTGPFSASFANASSDVYLTKNEKSDVRRAAGKSGLWTQCVTRGPIEVRPITGCGEADEYVPVDPAGKDMPFL